MSLLFETIKVLNNKLVNIEYHNDRVNRSRYSLFNKIEKWDLTNLIKLPELNAHQVYKCRFSYDEKPGKIEITPYQIRRITTMRLVCYENISYTFKYNDRTELDQIKREHSDVDEVIIVKQGRLTDCTYANLVFFDGNKWITPQTPLLSGIKRQKYLDESIITEQDINVDDLKNFRFARIINAMIDLEEGNNVLIEHIQGIN